MSRPAGTEVRCSAISVTVTMSRLLFIASLLALSVAQDWDWGDVTALDEYINREDESIHLEFVDSSNEIGVTVYTYNLTSQKWMDEDYINRPVWWHHFKIAVPNNPTIFDTAHLYVTGGDNTPGSGGNAYISTFARETGAIAASIAQVPNQPLRFYDEPDTDKREDAIIARTWKHYIEHEGDDPDSDMILLLPMTKAAKVAMDFVVQEANSINSDFVIDKYVPSGISKRGWVAWLLAAVDPRVVAICPTVLDLLGWHENLHHHYRAYGGWSFAFGPYWNDDIPTYIDHPRAFEIFNDIGIDPLSYNPRLTMPKLLSIASSDEFFLPDDTHYFWEELTPPKYMTLYENTGHGMGGQTARRDENIRSFFLAVVHEEDVGYITVSTDRAPNSMQAWWADTTQRTCEDDGEGGQVCRRDFRTTAADAVINPLTWETSEVESLPGFNYRATFDQRDQSEAEGYRGFFVQMEFDGYEGRVLDLTTEVHIIPDTFPYPRCSTPEECQGTIK